MTRDRYGTDVNTGVRTIVSGVRRVKKGRIRIAGDVMTGVKILPLPDGTKVEFRVYDSLGLTYSVWDVATGRDLDVVKSVSPPIMRTGK